MNKGESQKLGSLIDAEAFNLPNASRFEKHELHMQGMLLIPEIILLKLHVIC